MKQTKTMLTATLVCCLFFTNCETENTSISEKTNLNDTLDIQSLATSNNDYQFVPPSPLQIASIFKSSGLDYDASLTNQTSNTENYVGKFKQSINFGVYSSDLAYCILNEKYDDAATYLNSLKELSYHIGLETVFGKQDLLDRFEKNMGVKDSIVNLLLFIHENTDEYIEQNGKNDLAVVYYAGAWIEGMYFGAIMNKETSSDNDLGVILSERIAIARSLYSGLTHLDIPTMEAKDMAESIKEIIDLFDGFETVIALGDEVEFLDIELTPEEIDEMSNLIIALRQSIVE